MSEIPRTKFNSPWTVANIEAALNDVSSAKGSSESLTAALNAMRAEINSLSGGVHLKGAVDYYSDLPAIPSEGDAYTVRYQGTSGTEPLGIEYAWATYQGTPQWIPIGVDPSVFAKQTEMNAVANAGAKNDFDIENLIKSAISENVTYSLSGYSLTASSNGRYARVSIPYKFKAGTTVFTSVVSEYSKSGGTIYIRFATQSSSSGQITSEIEITGNGQYQREITVNADTNGFVIYYMNGSPDTFVNSAVFTNNMIRPAAITDATFQPCARTNRELTVLTDEDRAALVELVDGGAKNFVQVLFTSIAAASTKPSITNNNDGTITINGTRTGSNYIPVYDLESDITSSLSTRYTLPAGKYVATTINHTYATLQVYMHDGTNMISLAQAASYGVDFEYTETDKQTYPYICFRLNLTGSQSGIIYSNVTIYPMVCSSAAWKISNAYQPYRPSWQEMYERIVALESGSNRALTMQIQQPEEQEER